MDGFLLDANGTPISFPTKGEAAAFAQKKGLSLDADEFLLSSSILRRIYARKINCNQFLNYWNIFSDMAHSINCPFIGDSRDREVIQQIYEKLFYGCNVLAKENQERYRPKWSRKERRWIAKVMRDGFQVLSKGLNAN